MSTPVRVGFLGAGLIATYHSKSLRHAADLIERAGVYDPDDERVEHFAAASGHRRCLSESEVLDSCDAVYICTWTSEHSRLVNEAIARGVHVFCEKPLATDLAGAERMAKAMHDSGKVHQVGLVLRRSPAFRWAQHLATESAAGAVMSVACRDDQFIPIQGHYASAWRADRARAGSGTLLEHSIHDIDLLRWIVGDVETVSAHTANRHGHDGIEDVAAATMRFRSGALGTLTSVWHDNLARPSLRRLEVFCTNRTVVVDGDDWYGPVTWTDADGATRSLLGDELVAAADALPGDGGNPDRAFIEAIVDGRPASPGFDVAVRAHQVVDAIYRSAAAGGDSIRVPQVPRNPDGDDA